MKEKLFCMRSGCEEEATKMISCEKKNPGDLISTAYGSFACEEHIELIKAEFRHDYGEEPNVTRLEDMPE